MKSEQINELAAALAKAQSKITNPSRNKQVSVRTKSGGTYEFAYADLAAIYDCMSQPLTDNGLWPIQTIELGDTGKYRLVTTLLHSSGQWISSETPLLIEEAGNQKFGSALTFMRRYALCALIGVAADSDDDANSADGNEIRDQKPLWSPNIVKPPKPAEPVSGEPRLIAIPKSTSGNNDWVRWGKELLEALDSAKSLEAFETWEIINGPTLSVMQTSAVTTFDRLTTAIAVRREKFMQEAT